MHGMFVYMYVHSCIYSLFRYVHGFRMHLDGSYFYIVNTYVCMSPLRLVTRSQNCLTHQGDYRDMTLAVTHVLTRVCFCLRSDRGFRVAQWLHNDDLSQEHSVQSKDKPHSPGPQTGYHDCDGLSRMHRFLAAQSLDIFVIRSKIVYTVCSLFKRGDS